MICWSINYIFAIKLICVIDILNPNPTFAIKLIWVIDILMFKLKNCSKTRMNHWYCKFEFDFCYKTHMNHLHFEFEIDFCYKTNMRRWYVDLSKTAGKENIYQNWKIWKPAMSHGMRHVYGGEAAKTSAGVDDLMPDSDCCFAFSFLL